jgi:hypothetical protein
VSGRKAGRQAEVLCFGTTGETKLIAPNGPHTIPGLEIFFIIKKRELQAIPPPVPLPSNIKQ